MCKKNLIFSVFFTPKNKNIHKSFVHFPLIILQGSGSGWTKAVTKYCYENQMKAFSGFHIILIKNIDVRLHDRILD